jgi:hypothetical protein
LCYTHSREWFAGMREHPGVGADKDE